MKICFLISILICLKTAIIAQSKGRYIQLSGVILNDSLQPLPYVSVSVKNTKQGTISDFNGFFTFVVKPGQELYFFSINHQRMKYTVPDTLTLKHYSIIQVLPKDTVMMQEVVVYPWPTKEQFKQAILNLKLTESDYERAYKNMQREDIRIAAKSINMDAGENFTFLMNQQYSKLYSAGQYPGVSLLNPIAWAKFIEAWRSGKLKIK